MDALAVRHYGSDGLPGLSLRHQKLSTFSPRSINLTATCSLVLLSWHNWTKPYDPELISLILLYRDRCKPSKGSRFAAGRWLIDTLRLAHKRQLRSLCPTRRVTAKHWLPETMRITPVDSKQTQATRLRTITVSIAKGFCPLPLATCH